MRKWICLGVCVVLKLFLSSSLGYGREKSVSGDAYDIYGLMSQEVMEKSLSRTDSLDALQEEDEESTVSWLIHEGNSLESDYSEEDPDIILEEEEPPSSFSWAPSEKKEEKETLSEEEIPPSIETPFPLKTQLPEKKKKQPVPRSFTLKVGADLRTSFSLFTAFVASVGFDLWMGDSLQTLISSWIPQSSGQKDTKKDPCKKMTKTAKAMGKVGRVSAHLGIAAMTFLGASWIHQRLFPGF